MSEHSVPAPPEGLPTRGAAGWALVILAFAVGFINFPLQVLGAQFQFLPGDPADNRFNNYVLEHGYRYLTGRENSFWDAPMFFPTPGVTAWSDAHLGMIPFYTAMRAVGLSPEGAFQGHFVLCFVLNFAAALWAMRRLGFGSAGATVAAYVFAFGLPLSAQLQHTQLYARFLVPHAIVFAWEFLHTPRAWRLVAAAWCVAGQMYLTVYIGFFLAFLLAVGGAVTLLRFAHRLPWKELLFPGWRDWAFRVAGVATAGLAVMWLADQHRRGGTELPLEHIKLFAPKPKAWLTPPSNAGAFPELAEWTKLGTGMPNSGEQQLCPGLLPLAAVALGALMILAPVRFGDSGSAMAVAGLSALLIGFLFTQYGETWYYERLAKLPGAKGIRAIGRVNLVLIFASGIVMAAAADLAVSASRRRGRGPAIIVALIVLGVTVADQWLSQADGPRALGWVPMRTRLDDVLSGQARLAEAINRKPNPTPMLLYVFASPASGGPIVVQPQAMRAAQDLGIPCVNGWSGHWPEGWNFFSNYRELMTWLAEKNAVSPDRLAGLIIVGEPTPDADSIYETRMRALYPPR